MAIKRKKYTNQTPQAKASSVSKEDMAIITQIAQEFTDQSRKDVQKWRRAMTAAEHPTNPRWFQLQDMIADMIIDGHMESVLLIRNSATLNHRFYVADIESGDQLEEQTRLLKKQWFYKFLESSLKALVQKYNIVQLLQIDEQIKVIEVPARNIEIRQQRMYTEVNGDKFVEYTEVPNCIEIVHSSRFGIVNSIIPNIIWKRNAMQAWAEFGDKFGMPLITATTNNRAEVGRIEAMLRVLGEAAQAVLPFGTDIKIHDLANAGNPVNTYLKQIEFHDAQISKPIVGSATLTDSATNRSQTEVHERTLDNKISLNDKRFITFTINDQLFPLLQSMGLPFDNATMHFVFDETESLSLTEQWKIVNEASENYELETDWVATTFNLPITGIKQPLPGGIPNTKAKGGIGLFKNFH